MKSHLYHLQINVTFAHLPFYKELFTLLGWGVIFENPDVIGFKTDNSGDIWLMNSTGKESSDYDNLGMNHVSIRVETAKNVDELVAFLKSKKVEALFETPRHRPEFAPGEDHTYYQVMFKSEDNILFEVVYIGPKK